MGFRGLFWKTSNVLSDNFSATGHSVLPSVDLRNSLSSSISSNELFSFPVPAKEVKVILIYDRSIQKLDGINYTLGTSTSQQLSFIKNNIKSTYELLNKYQEWALHNIHKWIYKK